MFEAKQPPAIPYKALVAIKSVELLHYGAHDRKRFFN